MFNSLEIERFRGIRHSKIEGLKRINLFFGKNNCGKSSLLDSVFLIAGMSNPKLPLNINLLRSYKKFDKSDMQLDFYGLDISSPIVIKAENEEKRELNISVVKSTKNKVDLLGEDNKVGSTDAENAYGLELKCKLNDKVVESAIVFTKTGDKYEPELTLDSDYNEGLTCRYLSPAYDFYTSLEGLRNAIKNKDEGFLLDALRLIEPKLNDVMLSQDEILVDIGMGKRIPINMMGDGARKILSILSTIYECKNGIILIDEISNGFHYSVMKGLWQCILSAAEKNNVQVFATTHDIDSIRGLRDAVLPIDPESDKVACFKLQKTKDDELKSYHYSLGSVDYSINQEIEIR